MGLNWAAYTYAVTGVRMSRPGNVGPALIEIERSKNEAGYQGTNLDSDPAWVFNSPMSWDPSSTRALWPESRRGGSSRRLQVLRLAGYRAGPAVAPQPTPEAISYGIRDLSVIKDYASTPRDIDVKVYGRASGYITYRRNPLGVIEKTYVDFSDDGQNRWSGRETMQANPHGRSTYAADVTLTGSSPGVMKLKMTFGPLAAERPAELIVDKDASGTPLSHGYAEFGGKRLDVSDLTP